MPYALGHLLRRRPWRLPCLLGVVPVCVRFLLGRADHGAVKSVFIRMTLGGLSRAELAAWTETFVPRLVTAGTFAAARERIAMHRAHGDYLVLLSASTELYVPQIAAALGFAESVCTGLTWQADHLEGRLATPNRRGEEKARCLERLRAAHAGKTFAAYGNTLSDIAHLRLAQRPLLVNGNRAARACAQRYGIPSATWH